MNIVISNESSLPIYEQIVNQMKNELIQGNLQEGDAMPSIRSLARDLQISVITTNRAYSELEKEGLIYSVAGKGFYVSHQNTNMLKEKKIQGIEEHMTQLIRECRMAQLSREDTIKMLTLLWEE